MKYRVPYPLHELPADLVDGYRAVQRGYEAGMSLKRVEAEAKALADAQAAALR